MKVLETSDTFPYLAWLLIISFAFLVYFLAVSLQESSNTLAEKTLYIENAVKDSNNI